MVNVKNMRIQREEKRVEILSWPNHLSTIRLFDGVELPIQKVIDVSKSGIGFEVDRYLEPTSDIKFILGNLELSMRIVHCNFDPNKGIFRSGCKLYSNPFDTDIIVLFEKIGANLKPV